MGYLPTSQGTVPGRLGFEPSEAQASRKIRGAILRLKSGVKPFEDLGRRSSRALGCDARAELGWARRGRRDPAPAVASAGPWRESALERVGERGLLPWEGRKQATANAVHRLRGEDPGPALVASGRWAGVALKTD